MTKTKFKSRWHRKNIGPVHRHILGKLSLIFTSISTYIMKWIGVFLNVHQRLLKLQRCILFSWSIVLADGSLQDLFQVRGPHSDGFCFQREPLMNGIKSCPCFHWQPLSKRTRRSVTGELISVKTGQFNNGGMPPRRFPAKDLGFSQQFRLRYCTQSIFD